MRRDGRQDRHDDEADLQEVEDESQCKNEEHADGEEPHSSPGRPVMNA